MNRFTILWAMLLFLGIGAVQAQVSPDCSNAIPICNNTPVNGGTTGFGIDDFNGASVSGCLEQTLTGAIESNSAWYRFRTGASGQLGFNIGIDTLEDWDFALYRSNDCSNLGEPVRCNFFDNQDENTFIGVGEDPTGNAENVQYEAWLDVEPGEDYYLLINNFSNNNSGFSIQFSGHIFVTNPFDALDCSIINNLLGPPIAACENETVVLDGTTSGASLYRWFADTGSGFAEIVGENGPTYEVSTSANYRLEVIRPSETIISDVQVFFTDMPVAQTVTDDASCGGLAMYDLSQKDSEVLGVQSPNEFLVTYHATMADAVGGANALPKQYQTQSGSQTIFVRVTSIGNSRCYDASQQFQMTNIEAPVLDFPSEVFLCEADAGVRIGLGNTNPNYSYQWSSGETSPNILVSAEGNYELTVTHSQSGLSCSDSRTVTVLTSRPPEIIDIEIEDLQNNNTVTVLTDASVEYEYRLDNGAYQTGNKFYQVEPGMHTVTVKNPQGCGDVSEQIVVIGFPKFFTPNGDGSNEFWSITGADLLDSPILTIYNRFGKLLAQLDPSNSQWDGSFDGKPLPETDYWFKLTYTAADGQTVTAKYINNHFSLKR
ncbi:T9SS type B sorting domain-containing protein [Zobellia sp. B3R18]|uniref:T9SS type B sorting domain-containing protein n=1 Tax=Zobellia sp. B3R18 TaxID=2841568 RepID=UPI001C066D31|nr:T9SS type B sorting domain-containing protein [Zobellia sp. B3R18]MBU2973777.1 T9SS type B sorting domain-containing protein [Zobellia sp. B3R18]